MRSVQKSLLVAALLLAAASGPGIAAIEDGYDARDAAIPSTWYRLADPAAMRVDRDYVAGMRPHHAGALTMSQEYLADPEARSPVLRALATGIIRNQRFEIGLMDEIARNLDQPPLRLLFGVRVQPMATEGVAQLQRFIRSPIPGPAEALAGPPPTARDVLFAKAMSIHHQAALGMAGAYLANGAARNGFLGLMNVDVVTDQTQEIALMQAVIRAYPGNPDLIIVDPASIHGMEGMRHAGPAGRPHADHAAQAEATDPHADHSMSTMAVNLGAGGEPVPATAPVPRRRARPAAAPDPHAHHH